MNHIYINYSQCINTFHFFQLIIDSLTLRSYQSFRIRRISLLEIDRGNVTILIYVKIKRK